MHPMLKDRFFLTAISIAALIPIGVSSLVPAIPELALMFNVSKLESSLLITVFTLPGILLLPFAGFIADRYGHKAVLAPALVVFILSGTACAWAPDFNSLLALRFIQGLSATPFAMLSVTVMADRYSGTELVTAMAFSSTAINLGTALAPAVGGTLAAVNYRLVFILPLLGLFTLFFCLRVKVEKSGNSSTPKEYLDASLKAISSRNVLVLIGLGFCNLSMMFGPLLTCFPILAHSLYAAPPHFIGYVQATMSVGATLGAASIAHLSKKTRLSRLLLVGQFCYAASFALVVVMPGLWMQFLPVFIFGMGMGISSTIVMSLIAANSPPEQRGSVLSAYGMGLCLSQGLAPMFFSYLAQSIGVRAPFMAGSGLALIMMALTGLLLARSRSKLNENAS